MSNINVLGEAKAECTDKLCRVITPVAIDVMLTLYNDASEMAKGKKILTQYQKLLQEVKTWNESIIHANTQKVLESCSYFRDILTAVFICYTKIMSSIRLGKVKKSINLKIPSNDIFIHAVFTELADMMYHNPYFLQEKSAYDIKQEMNIRVLKAVNGSIKLLVPLDEIFKTYINTGDEHVLEEESEDESEDPDVESEGEAEPMGEPVEEPIEEPNFPEMGDDDDDEKVIPLDGEQQQIAEPEEENLFDDAVEKNM